jgi:hypothetical protein
MHITEITDQRTRFMHFLLIADPSERMVMIFLEMDL